MSWTYNNISTKTLFVWGDEGEPVEVHPGQSITYKYQQDVDSHWTETDNTDEQEEIAEQLPGDKMDICCAQYKEEAEYWKKEALHCREETDRYYHIIQNMEADLGRVRYAIGSLKWKEILGDEPAAQELSDEQPRATITDNWIRR